MRAVCKKVYSEQKQSFIEKMAAYGKLESASEPSSKTSEADSSKTAAADVSNPTEHPRFKRKFNPCTPLSYKPQSTSPSEPKDSGSNTEPNLTTINMHPRFIRKAHLLYNRVATDRSRQSTPFSSDSSRSSLTLATSENEFSGKEAFPSKDPKLSVSPQDTENVKPRSPCGATHIPISEPNAPVAPADKGRKSRQSSGSSNNSERITTRSIARSAQVSAQSAEHKFLPPGPQHLEYDYARARKNFEEAVYAAIYDHFGWSPRLPHQSSVVPKPGLEDIALVAKDLRVKRAARVLNEADDRLKEASERGETWENTPIPDELQLGSEFLKSCEDFRVSEEVIKQPREGKSRASPTMEVNEDTADPIIRGKKMNQEAEASDPQPRVRVQTPIRRVKVSLLVNTESKVQADSPHNDLIAPVTEPAEPIHAGAPFVIVLPPRAQGNSTTEPSSSAPAKRGRGRPRKRKVEDDNPPPVTEAPPVRQSKRRRTRK